MPHAIPVSRVFLHGISNRPNERAAKIPSAVQNKRNEIKISSSTCTKRLTETCENVFFAQPRPSAIHTSTTVNKYRLSSFDILPTQDIAMIVGNIF